VLAKDPTARMSPHQRLESSFIDNMGRQRYGCLPPAKVWPGRQARREVTRRGRKPDDTVKNSGLRSSEPPPFCRAIIMRDVSYTLEEFDADTSKINHVGNSFLHDTCTHGNRQLLSHMLSIISGRSKQRAMFCLLQSV